MDFYNNEIELPLGFGIALAKDNNAMQYFSSLSKAHQSEIIARTHSISSKKEMELFVASLDRSMWL